MKDWKDFKKELLKDPEFKQAYDDLEIEYKLIEAMIEKRINEGITQKELAEQIGTKQSAIARFESGRSNPTLEFIQKLAHALNVKITVS